MMHNQRFYKIDKADMWILGVSDLNMSLEAFRKNITACKKSVISITEILANYFIFFKT